LSKLIPDYRKIFEKAVDPMIICDLESTFLYVNDALCNIYGYTRDELMGMRPQDLDAMEDEDKAMARLEDIRQKGQISFDAIHSSKGGNLFHVHVTCSVIDNEYFYTIFHDITSYKEWERTLKVQRDELSEFSHTVAHAMRNKLSIILYYLDFLQEGDVNRKIYHKKARKVIEDSLDYIEKQLRLADAGKIIGEMRMFDPNAILSKYKKLYHVDLVYADLPIVMGDPIRLEDVFDNIISNSIIHGKAKTVNIESFKHDGICRFVIKDDGTGIDDDVLPHIFNAGFSTNSSGYGLHIVKRIIEAHGGSIEVSSQIGNGTSVSISLPHCG